MHNSKTFDRIKTIFATLILGFFVTAFATGITIDQNDIFQFGRYNSGVDKKIVFNKGSGSANPAIRVGTSGVVEIANDGTTFSKVLTTGQANTISGAQTFSSPITVSPTSSQIVLGTTNTTTISATAPSASRVYVIPDVGSGANFVLDVGASSFGGSRTFSSAVNITPVSNQLVLGTGTTVTLNGAAPAANRVYTFPDAGASANVVLSEGAATINGVKTHSSQIPITATTNQLVLGTTNTTTISAVAPAASRTISIQDPGANADFVTTAGAQTLAGVKTHSSQIPITATTNQLVLGTTNTTTISASAPAASRTLTIPDPGSNTNFILGAFGSSQSIASDVAVTGALSATTSFGLNSHALIKNTFGTVANGANIDLTVASNFGGLFMVESISTGNGNDSTSAIYHAINANSGTNSVVAIGGPTNTGTGCTFSASQSGTNIMRATNTADKTCTISTSFFGNNQ